MNRTQYEYVIEEWNHSRAKLTRLEIDSLAHFLTLQEAHFRNWTAQHQAETPPSLLLRSAWQLETRPIILTGAFYRFAQPDGSTLEVRAGQAVRVETDDQGRAWIREVELAEP